MDEILKMSRETNYNNLVYDFVGPNSLISFTKVGGPMYTYNQFKIGEKTLQQVEEDQNYFKKYLNEITPGNPKRKSERQLYTIKNRNLYNSRQKKLLIYLMIMQKLDLKPFINQSKMKLKEKDSKY